VHEVGPDVEAYLSPERIALAESVRHLLDAVLTAEDATDVALARAAAAADRITAELAGASRARGTRTRDESGHMDYLPRSPFVGQASPLAPPFAYEFRDGRILAHGVFHAAYEGPPGYAHGGWIALAFDEILGMANIGSGHPAMTGTLKVRYRRPTPLHAPVSIEAWTDHVDGRRVITRGTMTAGDQVTAEAEGLFVKIGAELALEYFGRVRESTTTTTEGPDPLP